MQQDIVVIYACYINLCYLFVFEVVAVIGVQFLPPPRLQKCDFWNQLMFLR